MIPVEIAVTCVLVYLIFRAGQWRVQLTRANTKIAALEKELLTTKTELADAVDNVIRADTSRGSSL